MEPSAWRRSTSSAWLLAAEAPELADLSSGQLEALARLVLGQRLARDLARKTDVDGIDCEAEKATFLETAGGNPEQTYEPGL